MAFAPTPAQKAAINTRDRSLILSAAAGSGKTAVLTQRVIAALTDPVTPLSISRLLAATFTESAASEMRSRIGSALAKAVQESGDSDAAARELRLLPAADISTIDAFCHKILRRYGGEHIPEGFRVTDAAEADNYCAEQMEDTIAAGYAGKIPSLSGEDFSRLTDRLVGVSDEKNLAETFLNLYRKLSTYERGVATLDDFADRYTTDATLPVFETTWGKMLKDLTQARMHRAAEDLIEYFETEVFPMESFVDSTVPDLCRSWLPSLKELASPTTYTACREAVLFPVPTFYKNRHNAKWKPLIDELNERRKAYKAARTALLGKEKDQVLFTYTEEEWHLLYRDLAEVLHALSAVLSEFDRRYFAESLRRRAFDFNQLERATYDLLIENGERTETAKSVAACYDMICVDEYQDVSPLQHAIFEAISDERNRFFVGDIKQSIYRFRHAEPEIFAALRNNYPRLAYDENTGEVPAGAEDEPMVSHFMSENFRCDREIVRFVNRVFSTLFGAAGESIGYRDEYDCLRHAKSDEGVTLFPRPEVVIFDSLAARQAAEKETAEKDGLPTAKDLAQEAEKATQDDDETSPTGITDEAAWVAAEIHRLLTEGSHNNGTTPLRPSDIVLLSRSVSGEAKTLPFVRALARYGIPVALPEEKNFFLNPEVLLAVSLLEVIDNPLRDVPLAGVLCSPLYRFTPDHLAAIRRETTGGIPLYDALRTYCTLHPDFTAGAHFLSQLASLRETAEDSPVSMLIRRIFAETPLLSIAGTDGRPGEKNLKLLYHYACAFEGSDYPGLYGFLKYITRQSKSGSSFKTPAQNEASDAVRIMTIHGSKGLEFPVVFVINCGATFSHKDEKESILIDSRLGAALPLRVLSGQVSVENPIRKLLAYALREKGHEEEMRLLYVALTRARERLYVTGTVPGRSQFGKVISERAGAAAEQKTRHAVLDCTSYLEWMTAVSMTEGKDPIDFRLISEAVPVPDYTEEVAETVGDEHEVAALEDKLTRTFDASRAAVGGVRLPKKLAVSKLYPRLLDGSEDEETELSPTAALDTPDEGEDDPHEKYYRMPAAYAGTRPPDPTERGIATHLFMQFCDFRRLRDLGVDAEMTRLTEEQFLSPETAALTRPEELETFRNSALLDDLLSATRVRREFRFHMFLPAEDFTASPALRETVKGQSLFIQGVIDALIERADGTLVLIDYKTDRLTREERRNPALAAKKLISRHGEQMHYYAAAVERIFGRAPDQILLYALHTGTAYPVPLS